jgi:hypothetical protein
MNRFRLVLPFAILLVGLSAVPARGQAAAPSNDSIYSRSLHFTTKGFAHWYAKEQGGPELITGQPYAALGCGEETLGEIRVLSRIVDIGLIGIDERLLKNRTHLSGRDRQEYMRHVDIGRGIIAGTEALTFMEPLYLQVYRRYDEQRDAALPGCVLAAVAAFDDIAFERGGEHMEGIRDWLRRQKSRYCPEVVEAMISLTHAM